MNSTPSSRRQSTASTEPPSPDEPLTVPSFPPYSHEQSPAARTVRRGICCLPFICPIRSRLRSHLPCEHAIDSVRLNNHAFIAAALLLYDLIQQWMTALCRKELLQIGTPTRSRRLIGNPTDNIFRRNRICGELRPNHILSTGRARRQGEPQSLRSKLRKRILPIMENQQAAISPAARIHLLQRRRISHIGPHRTEHQIKRMPPIIGIELQQSPTTKLQLSCSCAAHEAARAD